MNHFCTCPVMQCSGHPSKHNQGCTPCMKDNLEKSKMTACMFKTIGEDVSERRDYTIKGYVNFYWENNQENKLKK